MVICLDQGANDMCMVQLAYGTLSSLAPVKSEWFAFLVPAYPGCPGKKTPLNGCSRNSKLKLKILIILA